MNQGDFVAAVADANPEFPRGEVEKVVRSTFEELFESLKEQEEVSIVGFGKFAVQEQAARTARNPRTGEQVDVPAKGRVKFTPSKPLREAVA